MKTITTLFFFLLIYNTLYCQSVSQNLFVEIDVSDESNEIVKYGRLVYNEDLEPSKVYFDGNDERQMFLDTLACDLSNMPKEKQNTLLFIHGMWAYKWSFLKGMQTKMQSDIWSNDANPNGMVVTVIWHCKVKYHENREMAIQSGKILSPLIMDIHDVTAHISDSSETNYLIHSMGNRVFQSIWKDKLHKGMQSHAGHILMIGADLETDVFEAGEDLADINYLSDDILVYVHNNDRVLAVSKAVNKKDRLGLQGIADFDKIDKSIWQVDVSVINDNEDQLSNFSNHRYFYMSPTVRKDIASFYNAEAKEKIPRRKKLDKDRKYMLTMP